MAASRFDWDVFILSSRGEDTCHTFTASLYEALSREQIRVFRDDDGLNRGDELDPSVVEAIEDSAASVVVLSPSFANSHWCLEELAKLCELRSSLNRPMLPVFYTVDPSHVRNQGGDFKKDFEDHGKRFSEEKIQGWRQAMKLIGNLSGLVYRDNSDEIITRVVKRVLAELRNTPEKVAAYAVGLESPLENLMKMLNIKSNSIQVLGLHGMGGIGKTTLAKALYNKIVGHFQYRIFVSTVREKLERDGLPSLQTQFIKELFHQTLQIDDVNAGRYAIKERVHEKKVLIVLDDVDNVNQLSALVGNSEWFGEGSRIVITTRDRRILSEYNVNQCYEVRCLVESQALKLLSYHALRKEKPKDRLLDLSKQVVSITGGLPLALEVFGSFLYDKREKKEWEDALEKLKKIQLDKLRGVLEISFDSLDEEQQHIFLDIACLFLKMEMKREDVVDILKGCGFNAQRALEILKQKSLIKITEDETLWMHDQIKDMGRQIVQDENLVNPGMRSRLWDRAEIMTVLKNRKGTRCIQGIVLDIKKNYVKDPSADAIALRNFQNRPTLSSAFSFFKEKLKKCIVDEEGGNIEITIPAEPFESMTSLRLLQINHVKLDGKLKFLPVELKWLQWKGCRLKNLPSDFLTGDLAVLDLSESQIKQVWHSFGKKVAGNLRVLNLHKCHNLEVIPDLSGYNALEKLVLERCSRLVKIHKSVGSLKTLLFLNLGYCSNLAEFPSDVSGLQHLEKLILSGCSKLRELPESIGSMQCLKELLVDETAITKLPESIFHLKSLEKLSLRGCKSIKQLPMCIGKLDSLKELELNQSALEELPNSLGYLTNLEKLSLMWCESLKVIPNTVGNLKSLTGLFVNNTGIKELPVSLGSLTCLKNFTAGGSKYLSTLPSSIGGLPFLVELQLDRTPIENLPNEIGALKFVQRLEMRNCVSLTYLPESIGSMEVLHGLYLEGSAVTELPESIGKLENLVILRLNNCKRLHRLPDSIGNLKSLHQLRMQETSVVELPESFGMLSKLMVLKMFKKPLFRSPNNIISTENTSMGTLEETRFVKLPNSFSNLSLLEELDGRSWRISGKIPDDFEKLSSLEILNLGNNYFHSLPCSFKGLSNLRQLLLYDCQELESLPPLPSSLQELNLANCFSLESISDVSKLENLHYLNLTNCEKVVDIPGLECLKSLKRLYLTGCNACSRAVKGRLSKVWLKKLRNLSIPGGRIPAWFSEETVTFSTKDHKNREIKGVILVVVVALNHVNPDDYQIPAVVDIQAQVVKLDLPIYTHALQLFGVPRTNKDQVHFCRYPPFHPLVSMLKDGYKLRVVKRNPPYIQGVELKKSGIHLVYEDEDDYDGDEGLLDESQQTISQKLANFFSSFEEDDTCASSAL